MEDYLSSMSKEYQRGIIFDCSITKQTALNTMKHREVSESKTFAIAKDLIEGHDMNSLVPFSLVYMEDEVCNTENIETVKSKIEEIRKKHVQEKSKTNRELMPNM